jgi:hypothetical protein
MSRIRPDPDPIDRNGEPCEDSIGCLVMWVCLAGIALITFSALIGVLVADGC